MRSRELEKDFKKLMQSLSHPNHIATHPSITHIKIGIFHNYLVTNSHILVHILYLSISDYFG